MKGPQRLAERAFGFFPSVFLLGWALAVPQAYAQTGAYPFRPPVVGESVEPPLADGAQQTQGIAPPNSPWPSAPAAAPEPIDPPVPVVSLRVRVAASASPGQELTYRLYVQNQSQAVAHHVRVRNPLPANAKFVRASPEPGTKEPDLAWDFGTLAGGATREITLVLLPTGAGDIRNCAWVQFDHGQCVQTRVVGPDLRFRLLGKSDAQVGDPLTYQIEVTNAGQGQARGVRVDISLPPGLEYYSKSPSAKSHNSLTANLGTLAPGQTRRVEYQVLATRQGTLDTRAVVTAEGGLRQKADSVVTVGEAKLTLVRTGGRRRQVNRPVTYQVTVSNPGNRPATGVEIVEEVLPDMEFVSASGDGRLTGNQVRWALGTLEPGGSRSVRIVLRSRRAFEATTFATASAGRGLQAQAETKTLFENSTGLALEIDKSDDPLGVGREASYTIRVLNRGTATLERIVLKVTVPDQLKVTRTAGPANPVQEGPVLQFPPLPPLAPGTEAVYRVEVQALRTGTAILRAEATTDTTGVLERQVVLEESTDIQGDKP